MKYHNVAAFFFATFILTAVPALHSQTSSVWDGSNGDWSDASSWSSDSAPNNVPDGESFDVEISSGIVNLDVDAQIDSLTFSGGEITGSEFLSVFDSDSDSTMNWTGGTLSGGYPTRAYVDGTLNISGTENLVLDRDLAAFNINWQSNDILSSRNVVLNTVLNLPTGASNFLISGGDEDRITQAGYYGDTLIHDRNGKTVFAADDNFQNFGSITINQGTMEVLTDGVYATNISMTSDDSTFRLLGDSSHRLFEVSGGTGNLEIGNGLADFDGSFNIGRLEISEGSRLDLRGSASNSASSIINKGLFTSSNGGGFSIDSNSFVNEGTIVWVPDNTIEISGMDQNSGTLRILGGGTGQLVSSKAININGGSLTGLASIEGDINVGSSGTIAPGSGLFNVDGDVAIAGIFDVDVRGSLVDGLQQDEMLVNSASTFLIEYDQLNVFGTATIADGAIINLNFDSDYMPLSGDFFDILTADSLAANLDQIVFNTSIFEYSTEILTLDDPGFGTRQTLRFTVLNAVPEPSAVAFLFSAMLCGVLRRKRTG